MLVLTAKIFTICFTESYKIQVGDEESGGNQIVLCDNSILWNSVGQIKEES